MSAGGGEMHSITDRGHERKYFVISPILVLALSRDPYDYTFWNVVKAIARENGVCEFSTRQLAALAMMSEGKVSACRAYWLEVGLLQGELIYDPQAKQSYWRLTVPDFWEENTAWAMRHPTPLHLLAYKQRQKIEKKEKKPTTFPPRLCSRCTREFIPKGTKSHRCEECQEQAYQESNRVRALFGITKGKFFHPNDRCADCDTQEDLDLHLVEGEQGGARVLILCVSCHDKRHSPLGQAHLSLDEGRSVSPPEGQSPDDPTRSPHERVEPSPTTRSPHERVETCGDTRSPHEQGCAPHERGVAPHERLFKDDLKKIREEEDINNQKSVSEIWQSILDIIRLDAHDSFFRRWIVPAKPVRWAGKTLLVSVPDEASQQILENRMTSLVNRQLVGILNDAEAQVQFCVGLVGTERDGRPGQV